MRECEKLYKEAAVAYSDYIRKHGDLSRLVASVSSQRMSLKKARDYIDSREISNQKITSLGDLKELKCYFCEKIIEAEKEWNRLYKECQQE